MKESNIRSFDCGSFIRPFTDTYLLDPYFCRYLNVSTGNHTRLLYPGSSPPRPNHSGSRTAPVPQTRTPNSDHSTEHRPRPWSLLSRGHPAGSDPHLVPELLEYQRIITRPCWCLPLGWSLMMSSVTSMQNLVTSYRVTDYRTTLHMHKATHPHARQRKTRKTYFFPLFLGSRRCAGSRTHRSTQTAHRCCRPDHSDSL